MITYTTGNILESDAQALVNTVNTVGVMGKGLALQFKEAYPENYKLYRAACKRGEVVTGKMFVTGENSLLSGNRLIVNFPTKTDWRKPSEYIYIEEGLKSLKQTIISYRLTSIAVPPLGTRNGGLKWERVKAMIIKELEDVDCNIIIYLPSEGVSEKMRQERVRLTPARAMLLDVMLDLVSCGENVSEFSAEKIAYFLQRFGASDVLNLKFKRAVYGPYSGKVRYVLRYMNGSYLMGMSDLSKHPFDEIWLADEIATDVYSTLNKSENTSYKIISQKTKQFLQGYYSNYSLELLSTVDYLLNEDHELKEWKSMDKKSVVDKLCADISQWNQRKQRLFNKPNYVGKMLEHIEQFSSELS